MKSMTGFGKGSAETPDVQIEIEIKSVNQRFLDLQLRMPKQLNPLEGALRQSIKQTLQRGRIELYVTLKEKNINTKQIEIQWDLLERFMQEIDTEAKDRFDLAELPKAALLEQFLLHEAFLTISDQEPEESTLADGVMEALDQALAAIDQSRWVEGQGILQILQENQRQLQEKLTKSKTVSSK